MKNRLKDVIDFVANNVYHNISWKELGVKLQLEEKTVRRHFKTLNIKKNQASNKNQAKLNEVKNFINIGFSQAEIANYYKCSVRQITSYTNSQNLVNPNRKQKHIVLTEIEYQVVIGSLLGDGHLDKYGRLRLSHSCVQSSYLDYKEQLLKRVVSSRKKDTQKYDKRTNKYYCNTKMDTICCDVFTDLRNSWYTATKKVICKKSFEKIEALGIAIWFMDDGFKCNKGVKLATESFTFEDIKFMRNILLVKFDILFQIDKKNRMYLKKDEYLKFKNLVYPFLLPELYYKLQNDLII